MRIKTILISTFLTWFAYDLNLFRRRDDAVSTSGNEVSLIYSGEEALQRKEIERHRLDVIPRWLRQPREHCRSKCNYFSTAPRDHRYSDQRKIRRRINNL